MNPSLTAWRRVVPLFITVALMGLLFAPTTSAQYVETLGPTTATLAPGTGVVTAGVGLFDDGEGTINITIPAGASVEQVLLYWAGRDNNEQDLDLFVDGTPVTGTLVGTAALSQAAKAFAVLADITGVVTLTPGANTAVEITGFGAPDGTNTISARDGASIVAIIDDGSGASVIDFHDGADFAWDRPNQPADERVTVPQTFAFAATSFDRTASLYFMVGDTNPDRPDRLTISVDGMVAFDQIDFFVGGSGPQWSNRVVDVLVPAGATEVKAEVFSGPGRNPESLTWIVGGFSVEADAPPPPGGGCTFTQGYWKNHEEVWPVTSLTVGGVMYTQAELLDIFDTPVRGDKTISLAHQLIAAKLNVLNGADDAALGTTIADADQWLIDHGGIGSGQKQWDGGEALKNTLDAYNNGNIGPGHCDDLIDGNAAEASVTAIFNETPQAFTLQGAYPNPFRAQTMLRFRMEESAQVRLSVYDVMGREVAVLVDGMLSSGEHHVPFDASSLASGTYLYRLVTPQGAFTERMMLTR